MKNSYRLNVRFDLDDPAQKAALEFLQTLPGSRSAFIVEAVQEKIRHLNSPHDFTLEDIRQIIHDEMENAAFVWADRTGSEDEDLPTQGETAAAEESMLDFLDSF